MFEVFNANDPMVGSCCSNCGYEFKENDIAVVSSGFCIDEVDYCEACITDAYNKIQELKNGGEL